MKITVDLNEELTEEFYRIKKRFEEKDKLKRNLKNTDIIRELIEQYLPAEDKLNEIVILCDKQNELVKNSEKLAYELLHLHNGLELNNVGVKMKVKELEKIRRI